MPKASSPLVGFNNNVKHLGRIFHVQTEDSGVQRPRIVTHLFADGGRIIKSTRTDYSEYLGRPDLHTTLRRLMKEQHKAMFIALRDGQLNETIEKMLGPATAEDTARDSAPDLISVMPDTSRGQGDDRPSPTPTDFSPASSRGGEKEDRQSSTVVQRKPPPTLTDLVLADLESARSRAAPTVASTAPRPPVKGTPVLGTPPVTAPRPPVAAGRYAAARPANIFSTPPEPASLFGGSSISEQSLDEVILSYLAEDLDGTDD